MKNEFTYDELKNKYSKRVGNYKGRDVIVRSKYDDLCDNVYILYDAEGMLPSAPPRGFPLVVDGYVVAYVNDDGSLNRCREYKWVKLERQVEFDNAPLEMPLGHDSGKALVDSLLESAYNDILSDLMYAEG